MPTGKWRVKEGWVWGKAGEIVKQEKQASHVKRVELVKLVKQEKRAKQVKCEKT